MPDTGKERRWPIVVLARDEDGALEVATAVGDDPPRDPLPAYEQGGFKLQRYVPEAALAKAQEERDREKALREDAYRYQQAAEDLLNPEQKRVAELEKQLAKARKEGPEFERLAEETSFEPGQQRKGGLPGEEATLVDHVLEQFAEVGEELRKAEAEREQARKEGREEVREAALSDAGVDAASSSFEANEFVTGEFPESAMREALEAALDSLTKEGDE